MSKSLRIISGSLGSRRIKTLTNTNLKPTPEKLREKIDKKTKRLEGHYLTYRTLLRHSNDVHDL